MKCFRGYEDSLACCMYTHYYYWVSYGPGCNCYWLRHIACLKFPATTGHTQICMLLRWSLLLCKVINNTNNLKKCIGIKIGDTIMCLYVVESIRTFSYRTCLFLLQMLFLLVFLGTHSKHLKEILSPTEVFLKGVYETMTDN